MERSFDLWLGKAAPRYTSYPPATAFSDSCGQAFYKASLSMIPADEGTSLYLHIPFCNKLCLYCGCHTTVTQHQDRVQTYLNAVSQEMKNLHQQASRLRRITHVHLGGGSPNIMSERMMEELRNNFAHYFNFGSCGEIAVELDPRGITPGKASTLALCGVNRASLGVQDFTPAVQKAIHREQSFDLIRKACDTLRAAGIRDLNFDLLYGLPLQTVETIERSAEQAVMLKPARISLFSYAHLPALKKHQQALDVYKFSSPIELIELEATARRVFVAAGYVEIGMDHFALPSDTLARAAEQHKLHRNFQGYTDDKSSVLLGLGASSIGYTEDGFFQNERDITAYQDSVMRGNLPIIKGCRLTGEDRLRAAIIESFMCSMACDLEYICRLHHYSFGSLAPEMEQLKPFVEAGLLVKEGSLWRLQSRHRMAVRVICSVFDRYAAHRRGAVSNAA